MHSATRCVTGGSWGNGGFRTLSRVVARCTLAPGVTEEHPVPAFIALLRAVNVGGTGKLPMSDRVEMARAAGPAAIVPEEKASFRAFTRPVKSVAVPGSPHVPLVAGAEGGTAGGAVQGLLWLQAGASCARSRISSFIWALLKRPSADGRRGSGPALKSTIGTRQRSGGRNGRDGLAGAPWPFVDGQSL